MLRHSRKDPRRHGWLLPESPTPGLPVRDRRVLVSAAVGLSILVGVSDRLTGAGFSVLLFHLIPVGLVSWFCGFSRGFAMSAFAALVWFVSHTLKPGFFPDGLSYWNTAEKFGIFLVVAYVVSMQSTLKGLLEREKELSGTDPLTGAMNLRAFGRRVEEEIDRSRRYGSPFSLAYMDLDDFKEVNDGFGHASGDRLLKAVVKILRDSLRSVDCVGRLGGDEFAILLPETAAAAVMGKARERVAAIRREGEREVALSIGVVTCGSPPESWNHVLKRADALMYSAKKLGKNRILQEVVS